MSNIYEFAEITADLLKGDRNQPEVIFTFQSTVATIPGNLEQGLI